MEYRCKWAGNDDPMYLKYHDEEWGVPVHDDRKHFEFLILEGAQAGLSWKTILKRREGYRNAFANFDPIKVSKYTDKHIEKLVLDAGIIRNRAKIKSAINNAKRFLEVQKEFGSFDKYIWNFVKNKTIDGKRKSDKDFVETTPESDTLSKDLKNRGLSFVGSRVIYAHMQACGLFNDHEEKCFRKNEC